MNGAFHQGPNSTSEKETFRRAGQDVNESGGRPLGTAAGEDRACL